MPLSTLGWILGGIGLCIGLAFMGYWKHSGTLFFLIFGVGGALLLVTAMVLVAVG